VGENAALDALVAEASRGEEWALVALYREFQPALLRFLIGLAGGEAEDLAADTWIDMAQALPRFSGNGTGFRRLLFTIARRRAIDHGRKQVRRRTDPMPQMFPDGGSILDVADLVTEADSSFRAIERISVLLPQAQAEVVLLRVVSGLSVGEVAEIVGKSPAAVSVLQSRGLRRLAAKLGDRSKLERESSDRRRR
jgi:RNA polymerase sigma-70 factor (ECF subfamily)